MNWLKIQKETTHVPEHESRRWRQRARTAPRDLSTRRVSPEHCATSWSVIGAIELGDPIPVHGGPPARHAVVSACRPRCSRTTLLNARAGTARRASRRRGARAWLGRPQCVVVLAPERALDHIILSPGAGVLIEQSHLQARLLAEWLRCAAAAAEAPLGHCASGDHGGAAAHCFCGRS